MNNPFLNRNLTKTLAWPTLSWSSINAFTDYDKEKWYQSYVLGNKGPSNPAMKAGRNIGEALLNPEYLPQVPRPEIYELELTTKIGEINVSGHLDGWSPREKKLYEYKTTTNPRRWTQDKVDQWGQITMYCLLLWNNYKIKAEEITIKLIVIMLAESGIFGLDPTGEIKEFETKRTMKDLLLFGAKIKEVFKEMEEFVASYPQSDLR